MKRRNVFRFAMVPLCLIFIAQGGCSKEEPPKVAESPKVEVPQPLPLTTNPAAGPAVTTPAGTTPAVTTPAGTTPVAARPANPSDVILEVDGSKLTMGQIDREVKKKLAAIREQIPSKQLEQAKASLKKRVVEDFIIRTLLSDEIKRRKITASEKEIAESLETLKKGLPPGMTIEEMMKRNQITKEQLNQEIAMGVKVKKLVASSVSNKKKPTDKEITAFYKKNKDKFKTPETARARHILVKTESSDTVKIKAEKKAKAEGLRKELLAGANFVELAAKNSDCPSSKNGGDLGVFARGQMVKPFDEVAFSLKINEISPVVETEFGYHIIQVTERSASKAMPLDKDIKAKIATFLEAQRQQEAFGALIKSLREKANIVVYKEP